MGIVVITADCDVRFYGGLVEGYLENLNTCEIRVAAFAGVTRNLYNIIIERKLGCT